MKVLLEKTLPVTSLLVSIPSLENVFMMFSYFFISLALLEEKK